MGKGLAVSVLDLVGMRAGEPAGSAIARSVDLARHVEQWGYKRYWLAEHHSISGLACSATPVLIGHVAAATRTIRVGSGGVMLPNHAPLVAISHYESLSEIARLITGTRWSGPLFFGLKSNPSKELRGVE
jgi:luciferase family oxidoreductase group 1